MSSPSMMCVNPSPVIGSCKTHLKKDWRSEQWTKVSASPKPWSRAKKKMSRWILYWFFRHYSTLSSCPWKYVTSTDRNRKPQSVMEARCIHKICVDTTAADHLSGCKDDCYCKEVYKFVKVSRRKGGKRQMKKKRFRRVWEKISVGCTCACLDRDSWNLNYFICVLT